MNTYPDKTLTETMLSYEYSDNGVVLPTREDAMSCLARRGWVYSNGAYRRNGKTAAIYKVRDGILDPSWPHKLLKYKTKGYLVSFGGEPKSCYDLKFSKIKRPMI